MPKKKKITEEKIRELQEVAQGAPTILGGPPPDVEALVDSLKGGQNNKEVEFETEPSGLGSYKGLRFCVILFFAFILTMGLIPYVGFIFALLGRIFR